MTRRGLMWAMLALLGIVLTAALTWSVVSLAGQHIGLSGTNLKVVRGLAPPGPQQADPPGTTEPRHAHRTGTAGATTSHRGTSTRPSATAVTTTAASGSGTPPASGSSVVPPSAPLTGSAVAPSAGSVTPVAPSGATTTPRSGDGSGDSGSSSTDHSSRSSGTSSHRDD